MLMPSKLSYLLRLSYVVERKSLTDMLDEAKKYPLVLINAPAGYGKTTLVSQWASKQKNIGWYSLDENDNDSECFSMYLNEAILQAITKNSINSELKKLVKQPNLITHITKILVHLAKIKEHFYLVIDDYHFIENSEIHEALKFWLKNTPQNITLIIISRTTPPLNIAHLVVNELVLEINSTDLMFNNQESLEFVNNHLVNCSDEQIYRINQQVEGWPCALQLAVLYAKQHKSNLDEATKCITKIKNSHISNYLNEEIFSQIPDDIQDFLLKCSILRSLNEDVIKVVTQRIDCHRILENLAKQGLFIQPINITKDEYWWRFHPIFTTFLTQIQSLEIINQLEQLHSLACMEWLKLGYPAEALYHAGKLENKAYLVDILNNQGWDLFHRSELKILEQSLAKLSFNEISKSANLILLKAWLLQSQHLHHEVDGLLYKYQDSIKSIKQDQNLQAEFDALKAQVAINSGDDQKALTLALKSLKSLPKKQSYAHIVATSVIGEAYHCQGKLDDSLKYLLNAENMAEKHHAYHHILWSLLQQSEVLSAKGLQHKSYEILKKASLFVEQNNLQKLPMYEFLLRLKADILWHWYDLEGSTKMAQHGIESITGKANQLQCLTILGKISLLKGEFTNCKRILENSYKIMQNHTFHKDWITNNATLYLLYLQNKYFNLDDNQPEKHTKIANWLAKTYYPDSANNHFSHAQWRNIARAYFLLGELDKALKILNDLIQTARKSAFISELCQDLILRNRIYCHQKSEFLGQKDLIEALNLSLQTNFISVFIIEGEIIRQQLKQLLALNYLSETLTNKTQFILNEINKNNKQQHIYFDEIFVKELLQKTDLPEILKMSPLTSREWQVLGLIYSGYSNEQISQSLKIALTTLKTHIRNLYQKIGVSNRSQSIEYTKNLLKSMGYDIS